MILPAEPEQAPASYRFRRGSKLADMPPVPPATPVPPLSSFDGPFQLAEFLSLKVRHDPHDIKGLVEVPTDNSKAADKHVWIYEHLRRIPIDATPLVTQLLSQCNRKTCPEMKADEWQYLCVAHEGDGTNRCCAIDYILHALDSTTALLSSSSYFPSRLQIPHASLAHFPSLFRRLSRIFSHAYFHHREAFATAEAETSLYARFVALCERYELVGSGLLIIPQEGYEVLSQEDDLGDDREGHDEEDDGYWDDDTSADSGDHDDDYQGDDVPRGREKDEDGNLGRSHSLGRHPTPAFQSPGKWTTASPVQPANKGKPAPAQASESLSPPSTRAILDGQKEEQEAQQQQQQQQQQQTQTILPGKGRNTLSRGKAPRGANLWSADDVPGDKAAAESDDKEHPQTGMARRESIDSVVYVGKDGEAEEAGKPDSQDRPLPSEASEPGHEATQSEPRDTPTSEPRVEHLVEKLALASLSPTGEVDAPPTPAPDATSLPSPSEPLSIPAPAVKPRTPSPNKLATPPKPPAAASPGKASPAPAQASPTITSPPTKSSTLPADSSELSAADLVAPVPIAAESVADERPSALPTETAAQSEINAKPVAAGSESDAPSVSAPIVESASAAAAPVPTVAEPHVQPEVQAVAETATLDVPGTDSSEALGSSPKSELQARPGGLSVSPKSTVNKRNSKNRKDKGKKDKGASKSPNKSDESA